MARTLGITTLALWLSLFAFGVVAGMPRLGLLPLYGLYPRPGFYPTLMHVWAGGAGLVFLALAFMAVRRKNTAAGIVLLFLFLLSILRLLEALDEMGLHEMPAA